MRLGLAIAAWIVGLALLPIIAFAGADPVPPPSDSQGMILLRPIPLG